MQAPSHDALLAAHPVEIYAACESVFADLPWLSWEPETLLLSLKNDLCDESLDKLLATQAVAANPACVLGNADAFEKTVNAFCNNICVMDVCQPPEVEEMSYAASQIEKVIRAGHGENKKIAFCGDVPGYVAAAAKFRGWTILPKNLSFAQDILDALTGARKDSRLYREHRAILEAVTAFVRKTTRKDARELLKDDALSALEKDEAASLVVRKFLGALLYDPTLPHAQANPD